MKKNFDSYFSVFQYKFTLTIVFSKRSENFVYSLSSMDLQFMRWRAELHWLSQHSRPPLDGIQSNMYREGAEGNPKLLQDHCLPANFIQIIQIIRSYGNC